MSHIKFTRKTQFLSKETKKNKKTSPMVYTDEQKDIHFPRKPNFEQKAPKQNI